VKVSELCPLSVERVQFRHSEFVRVPSHSGCYMLSNIYDEVLYVGKSKNLCVRMQQHLDDSRMTSNTSLGLVSWFNYRLWTPDEIDKMEMQLLFDFKAHEGQLPTLNRAGP